MDLPTTCSASGPDELRRFRRLRRQDLALLLLATLAGLWLALSAPGVSPVAPPSIAVPAAASPVGQRTTSDPGQTPVLPVAGVDPRRVR